MGKTNRKTTTVVEAQAPRILEDVRAEAIAIAETDAQIALPHSVVKADYKKRYKANSIARGEKGKAAKRSNGDWLANQMKALVLDKREKLIVERLEAICEANGLDAIQTRWPNKNKGWEGRLRMTACLVLRKIVADNGVFHTLEGDLTPPADFIARNETR